jgi:hypothetical protein
MGNLKGIEQMLQEHLISTRSAFNDPLSQEGKEVGEGGKKRPLPAFGHSLPLVREGAGVYAASDIMSLTA